METIRFDRFAPFLWVRRTPPEEGLILTWEQLHAAYPTTEYNHSSFQNSLSLVPKKKAPAGKYWEVAVNQQAELF